MKNQIQKDKNKRILSSKIENKRIILKSIVCNNKVSKIIRWNCELKLTTFSSNNFKTGVVNRCIFTGRKGKFNKEFRFSRLSFLKLARNGFIGGLKK